jgi:hypothetical protein
MVRQTALAVHCMDVPPRRARRVGLACYRTILLKPSADPLERLEKAGNAARMTEKVLG